MTFNYSMPALYERCGGIFERIYIVPVYRYPVHNRAFLYVYYVLYVLYMGDFTNY